MAGYLYNVFGVFCVVFGTAGGIAALSYMVGCIVAEMVGCWERDRRTVYYDADGTSWEGYRR